MSEYWGVDVEKLYAYSSGDLYDAYKVFGAHFIEWNGEYGVRFLVYAPNVSTAYVSGDFSYWEYMENEMLRVEETGCFVLFIPNLKPFQKYKYVFIGDDKIIWKYDPYAFMSEGPGKSASLLSDVDNFNWEDEEHLEYRMNNNPYERPISIYEVNLASWRRDYGNYYSFERLSTELVDYVIELGFTHVEFMPITEYPFDGSWGYQQTGYYSVTSRHGSPKEFKNLVNSFHKAGIEVIVDWVPCHYPKDEFGLAYFDGSALYESDYWHDAYNPEWDTLNFDYGRNHVRNFLISNLGYLIEEYHIDGFRMDAVSYMIHENMGKLNPDSSYNEFAISFIKDCNDFVKRYPGVIMFAEESTAFYGVTKGTDEYGLGFSFKWNMGWANDTLKYMKMDPLYRGGENHKLLTFPMVYAFNERFVLPFSHDEVVHMKGSLINKMPGEDFDKFRQLRLLYLYQYTQPGKKLIFMGGEFAQFNEWNEYGELSWELLEVEKHRKIFDYVKSLNELYKNRRELYENESSWDCYEWIEVDNYIQNVIIYKRKSLDREILIALNFSPQNIMEHPVEVGNINYRVIFNSDSEVYGGNNEGSFGELEPEFDKIKIGIAPYSGLVLEAFYG